MKIDLHIHTKTGSDGNLPIEDVFWEAKNRDIHLMSVTDHDSTECQDTAIALAEEYGISYITGIELNVTFQHTDSHGTRSLSLDFLGYGYDSHNEELGAKLRLLREHRETRASQILEKLNNEFDKEGTPRFTDEDMENIRRGVDGTFGRPHIANYLVEKGLVKNIQEAFDRYLVKCDVPKYPLSIAEASRLVKRAGGILVLAHPNDPNGTSLADLTRDLDEQTEIIKEQILEHIDGLECWHSRNDAQTTSHYLDFAKRHGLIVTGGSDCHQKPILIGTVEIPSWVAQQPDLERRIQ
ncbi:MAG: hypothetical protein A2Y91_00190 [Chloroflexi bacterium RBG_13_54_8]|nr:MAG: hypothetical protein A2Y91_00190 [Chloroflexi bacterium RBG_13_54_8]